MANPVLLAPITNRESFGRVFPLWDADTGEPMPLVAGDGTPLVNIQFELRRCNGGPDGSYTPWYDSGVWNDSVILQASLGSGVTIVDKNVFHVYFSESQIRSLATGTFDVGCVISEVQAGAEFSLDFNRDFANPDVPNLDARQVFRGRLAVLDGFVTA